MPIISNVNNKAITMNDTDVQALKDMIRGSLETHINFFAGDYIKSTLRKVQKSSQIVTDECQKILDDLDRRLDDAHNGLISVNADDLIKGIYGDLTNNITGRLNTTKMSRDERRYINSFIEDFGNIESANYLATSLMQQNTDEGYDKTVEDFTLAEESMPGIDKIDEYNPNTGRVQALYGVRAGNSDTLKNKAEDKLKTLAELPKEKITKRKEAKDGLNAALKSDTGLHVGGEMSRIYSSELMNKKEITFGDLYTVFSGLNQNARLGDPEGGKLRPQGIRAGKIIGVGTFRAPVSLHKTLSRIAEMMNQIKKTEDPALRKTQAVQLAAFAYGMTISEHVFIDGNGRTCRLFADTILQTFGLPPHTPLPETVKVVGKTIGRDKMEFDRLSELFFSGIQRSDQILKEEKQKSAENGDLINIDNGSARKEKNKLNMDDLSRKLGVNKEVGVSRGMKPFKNMDYPINKDVVAYLQVQREKAANISSSFYNSPEYDNFRQKLNTCFDLAYYINKKQNSKNFDMKKAKLEYAKAVYDLKYAAEKYKEYKSHKDPDKLNSDDKNKLELMDAFLTKRNKYFRGTPVKQENEIVM